MYILVFAYALAGTFLHAAQSAEEKISEDKPFVPAFLGFTESTIVLGSVAALFAALIWRSLATAFRASTDYAFFLATILALFFSVPVLLWLYGYSHSKRFTVLCHLWLGAALGLAPVAAWVATMVK